MAWHDDRPRAAALAALFVVAACGATPTSSPARTPLAPSTEAPTATAAGPPPVAEIGPGEGVLNLIVRPGYAERGDNDPAYDWVTPFEEETGCAVTAFEAGTSEQIVSRVEEQGVTAWDGVSATGDVSTRLIAEGRIQPVDVVALFPDWQDLWPALQAPAHDTVDGIHYGVAHGWGANLLMWNAEVVRPDPTSWEVVYDLGSPHGGRVTAYDSAITIADAALYLSRATPGLGIIDPYLLTQAQFDAAVALLRAQRPLVGSYWGTPLDEITAFDAGTAVLGPGWPGQLRVLQAKDPPAPVKATVPREGVTGRAATWMLLAGAKHPNCMLRWMAWMISPAVQQQVAEYAAEAPANLAACALLDERPGPFGFEGFCAFHQAGDDGLSRPIRFWKAPPPGCRDPRGDPCVDYAVWLQQWDEIKAAG